MNAWLKKRRKAIVALTGAGVVIVGRHFGVDSEIYGGVVLIATALGVYGVSNEAA